MLVNARFRLPSDFVKDLKQRPVPWGFGSLSEAVYFRTYSRQKPDGGQEAWADTVTRVVEGVLSIRKDWLVNVLGKRWNEEYYQNLAQELTEAIFDMRMLPPGRGLWAMGTDFVYERGSHALNNCGNVSIRERFSESAEWLMTSLMCGVGVGFNTHEASFKLRPPVEPDTDIYTIPDSREGWSESVRRLIASYENGTPRVEFDYSLIRPAGAPIKGFGGVAAGPGPLKDLHERIRGFLTQHVNKETSLTRVVTDVMNAIGLCVVAGNVRRSAEIALGAAGDKEFLNLKNYDMYPERREIGWMSNNSVALQEREDFQVLPDLAPLIVKNGEPGILNFLNIRKYGRMGERSPDMATGINPCGEIPLESFELCNLVEVFPTRCGDQDGFRRTVWLATFYASTVALLRSHDPRTNDVVARNRRIGVSVSGIADWLDSTSVSHVFDMLNRAYEDVVRPTNRAFAREAGIPESVRVTTVKPSGTVSLLAGVSAGMHHPLDGHVLRRMRVAADSPVAALLTKAKVPNEPDVYSENTTVFEFPLKFGNGKTRSVKHVSAYEQAALVAMLQRCWADNSVSNTLTVQPEEFKQVERILALFAPQVKSLALLPDLDKAAYPQMPIERISSTRYEALSDQLIPVDWRDLSGSDGEDSRFCANDICEVPV